MQKFVHFHRTGNRPADAFYLLLRSVPQLVIFLLAARLGVLRETVEVVPITHLGDDLVDRVYHYPQAGGLTQSLGFPHFSVEIVDLLEFAVHVIKLTVRGVDTVTGPGLGSWLGPVLLLGLPGGRLGGLGGPRAGPVHAPAGVSAVLGAGAGQPVLAELGFVLLLGVLEVREINDESFHFSGMFGRSLQYKSDVEIRDDISDVTKVFPTHTILSTKHDCLISSLLKANVGSDMLDCLPTWVCVRD